MNRPMSLFLLNLKKRNNKSISIDNVPCTKEIKVPHLLMADGTDLI